jgi:hypothetical protein
VPNQLVHITVVISHSTPVPPKFAIYTVCVLAGGLRKQTVKVRGLCAACPVQLLLLLGISMVGLLCNIRSYTHGSTSSLFTTPYAPARLAQYDLVRKCRKSTAAARS